MRRLWVLFFAALALSGSAGGVSDSFKSYWYQGKAELNRYALDQARYGEIHKGEAVLIFVTEPFLPDKQVKYEFGDKSKAISVLKLNFVRKFFTGIYPYSVMTSVFSPVDLQRFRTLKATSSTQEWCGQTFAQMNFRNGAYETLIRSYFQEEGDRNFRVQATWLEDEIWTRIRLAPETLPTGEVEMIPALHFVRLWHVTPQPEKATVRLASASDRTLSPNALQVYTVEYKTLKRKLSIRFEKDFPYSILAWEETHPGGFGEDSPLLTTRGIRTNHLLLDYWNKHRVEDSVYRKRLGVGQN